MSPFLNGSSTGSSASHVDAAFIHEAVDKAGINALRMALYQVTGDPDLGSTPIGAARKRNPNFQSPGQLTGRKEDTVSMPPFRLCTIHSRIIATQPFEDPDATFIRSLTYRSADGIHFDDLAKQITELKKEVNKREQEKKALVGGQVPDCLF